MASPYDARRSELIDNLGETDAEAVIVSSGPNCQYFTGFRGEDDRELLVVLTPAAGPVAVTAEQYAGQVEDNADIETIQIAAANTPSAVVDTLTTTVDHLEHVLLDDNATAAVATQLISALEATVGLAGSLIGPMRLCKEDAEIESLRAAGAIADEVSTEIRELGEDAIGLTEQELAVKIRTKLHAKGGNGVSFPVSVGAGPNGARPTQYRHGDREIQPGEPVVIDFGTFLDGYASDQTRTCVFSGDPPTAFPEAHAAAKAGLDAGVAAVQPGEPISSVDSAVREAIDDYALADRFTHGTGHGVGLDAHEPPAVTSDSNLELQTGMVFSIEPGIYFPDEFGVRVEDLVVVTADGAERLNSSPYGWRPLAT